MTTYPKRAHRTPEFIYQSMVTAYENEWDWSPAGRIRFNHKVGAVCKFTLNITDSPYTGVLKDGIQTGLIRISLLQSHGEGDEYIPSAGIKFLRSGVKSANFVALPQIDERTNNIFATSNTLISQILASNSSTTFDNLGNPQIIKKFLQGDDCLSMVGLSDMTRYLYERKDFEI